ncbi:PREDICTED: odorant receptor 22c-like [Habropoda laboriosa]|uniref:odorant receptor 22c-like n=1 Tax=Habropoda laboriosa TaxID=597456 RepID=UPI00083D51EC|nr:PREDICTED: odorant receptor 22c-like [Habropoda laboriosa]
MYAFQGPLMLVGLNHITTLSLIVSLVLHVCGKFSILSYRIQNIQIQSKDNLNRKIEDFVTDHIKLIRMANSINSALEVILLIDLTQTSIRMAVLIYSALLSPEANLVGTFTYVLYILLVTSLLYLYSFIGERLAYESTKVTEAYYDTEWQELSVRNQKLLLLAMRSGRRTLYLTAGKVYNFSLYGFIHIMKTSFGYVSLLRTLT